MTICFRHRPDAGADGVGAVTDAMGSLSYALNTSAAMLAIGAIASAFQPRLAKRISASQSAKGAHAAVSPKYGGEEWAGADAQLPLNELYPWSSQ